MLPKSAFQTIVSCMVYDSDLSKSSKMQMVRFIESASSAQLQHYIIHGEIVKESDVKISEAIFVPAMLIGAAIAAARSIYDQEFSKAAKACNTMQGEAKKSCMKRYKLRGINGKIATLRREMGKCNQTSKPDKCRKVFMKYIESAQKQMKKIQSS